MRYAQINKEGYVIADSYLIGAVIAEDMIPLEETFDITNKRWINGEWIDCVTEQITDISINPSTDEVLAGIMLDIIDISEKQDKLLENLDVQSMAISELVLNSL